MSKEAKISVIVPVYNTEKYLNRCLESILNQTYKNIELIVVNDCSNGNVKKIVESYNNGNKKIKYLEHKKNKGLFQARLTGVSHATGDFIAFVDSDDYISIDFYRVLIFKAIDSKADIVIGNTVIEEENTNKFVNTLANLDFNELIGDSCLEQYFHQNGRNYQWHTVWNKIYKKELWDMAHLDFLNIKDNLVMTEDFAFSTPLFYYTKKIVTVKDAYYFYCQHDSSSTSNQTLTFNKASKNLRDVFISLNFVKEFLKSKKVYKKYNKDYNKWKNFFAYIWLCIVKKWDYDLNEKEILTGLVNKIVDIDKIEYIDIDAFYRQKAHWTDQYEVIKKMIANPKIKCVSFDIFDTLVWRPFLEPKDIFILMNDYFREVCGHKTLLKFSDMRPQCEEETRKIHKDQQDITYDQIYEHMSEKYNIPIKVIELLKQKEIDHEINYCLQRKSAYELYVLCQYLGKKIVFTSDMYLPKLVIEKILNKNGYKTYNELYVSNVIGLAKYNGDLFDYFMKDQNVMPDETIHLGDNYHADKEMAYQKGIFSFLFPKASDTFFNDNSFVKTNNLGVAFRRNLPEWRDSRSSIEFLGIRCMLAIVSNKYFDNPFISYNEASDFNGDPYLIGYYALGMYMYALVNWLLSKSTEGKYNKVIFMARDGYLPKKIWSILNSHYDCAPESYYFPTSRQAIMPLLMNDSIDLYKLNDFVNMTNNTPLQVIGYMSEVLDTDNINLVKLFAKYDIDVTKAFTNKEKFDTFIKIIIEKLYNKDKANKYIDNFREKYENLFSGKVAIFDVGYSAKPEALLSNIFGKPIDTFFVHVNSGEGPSNANSFGFKINTFFDFKPSYTGGIRETLMSELAPSCIKYKQIGDDIIPQFGNYICDYYEEQLVGKMQSGAIDFCKDMVHTFNEDLSQLVYGNYGASIPHEMFLHSASTADKDIFGSLSFEDTVGMGGNVNTLDMINKELKYYNQLSVSQLINCNSVIVNSSGRSVELYNRSKAVRLIYYTLFERETLKMRVREIVKNEYVISIIKWNYGALRTCKNKMKYIIHKVNNIKK